MAFQGPQSRGLESIKTTKRQIPIDQIIAVQGRSPAASGLENAGALLGQYLTRKAQLQLQGRQLASLSKMAGESTPPDPTLTPELYTSGLKLRNEQSNTKSENAQKRINLELQLEKLRSGYKEIDPTTGKITEYPGVQGISIEQDEYGNPFIKREPKYKPGEKPVKSGGGASQRGSFQQTQYADSADGSPLVFNRDAGGKYTRQDGSMPIGQIVTMKGNQEAVANAAKSEVILPKVDPFFDKLKEMGEVKARAALTPGVRGVFYPELNQIRNELRQVGFTFGGKNYTGTEAGIIEGALIPNALDSQNSLEKKRQALKGYLTGQLDLMSAANLLGPSGEKIKGVISGGGLKPITPAAPSPITPKKVGKYTVISVE